MHTHSVSNPPWSSQGHTTSASFKVAHVTWSSGTLLKPVPKAVPRAGLASKPMLPDPGPRATLHPRLSRVAFVPRLSPGRSPPEETVAHPVLASCSLIFPLLMV